MFGCKGIVNRRIRRTKLHYHFVFIAKYRKPALRGDVAVRLRDMIREICRQGGIEILKGHVRPEHMHLMLSVPPHLSPSRVMQLIKGKTSNRLMQEYRVSESLPDDPRGFGFAPLEIPSRA